MFDKNKRFSEFGKTFVQEKYVQETLDKKSDFSDETVSKNYIDDILKGSN
jgi:hypothetical protein